jgi:sortase (surface protein transpeptidase)
MITGRAQLYQNPTENTLFTSYYELRQGSEFVLNTINKLFDKYKPYETDNVYDKLT